MSAPDPFEDLARHYDGIMEHVDYERWFVITTTLYELLPETFLHLDAGCGTGTLIGKLRQAGWTSLGADLSYAMLHHGCKKRGPLPVAAADLRALPFTGSVHFLTCLFDSVNFLLEESGVRAAIAEFSRVLADDGILYFDVVTERMVAMHFENQTWTEDNDGFKTTWSNTYDRTTRIADTRLKVNTGIDSVLRERIYPIPFIEKALRDAGLSLLATYDADTWRAPTRRTTRVDFIAVKRLTHGLQKRFKKAAAAIRQHI